MLSNQILQRTINEIGDIIECNCSIWNTDGVMLAAVGKEKPAVKKAVCSFLKELEVTGVAEEHLDECYGLFPVYDDDELTYIFVIEHNNEIDVHTSGRLSVCQLESLLRSGSERLDRNRFIQNLLLDNLLLVDIYNQAKKLGITVEQRRVVYLIEPKNPDDTIVLDMIRGIYSSGTGDFVTAVDEGHIILIKSLDSTDDYDTIRSTADMLVNAINTEAMVNVRLSFGTIIPELKEVSQSYKEAGMALDVGRIFYPERNILSYRELGIGRKAVSFHGGPQGAGSEGGAAAFEKCGSGLKHLQRCGGRYLRYRLRRYQRGDRGAASDGAECAEHIHFCRRYGAGFRFDHRWKGDVQALCH